MFTAGIGQLASPRFAALDIFVIASMRASGLSGAFDPEFISWIEFALVLGMEVHL
jgi:hypothetical protein